MGTRKPKPGLVEQLRERVRDHARDDGPLNRLAKEARIHHSQLYRFLAGERDLTLAAAARLCAVLGLHLCAEGEAMPPAKSRG